MEKAQKIIVDGYNLIYADGELKRYAEKDMNRSRAELIERLKLYLRNKSVRMTVVFDGKGGMTDVEMVLPAKLQVMYSPFGQTADELIVKSLRAAANPREYIVITSDAADIGRAARSLGAGVISSQDFLQRIERNHSKTDDNKPEKPAPNEDDTDYWLKLFGDGADEEKKAGRDPE
jgi:predicted RNA-binding protein with PIN domain